VWYRYSQEIQKLPIELPDYTSNILSDIRQAGGRALIVGGAVRDSILGHSPKDIDFEVYGLSYEDLSQILSKYGKSDLVGQSFGVIKFVGQDGSDFDFSLPRLDSKSGVGHKDFDVQVRSDLTPEQAAARRDFTINAISYDPMTGEIIDPYNGRQDLQNKILRHTSDSFAEDVLRILRGMQFSSRFGFDIAPETAELAQSIRTEYQHLPKERVYEEFKKLVTKGIEPGKALDFLYTTGWSENFPEIHDLKNTPQDSEWHPEGWSVRIVPPDSFTAGVAISKPIDLLSRELLLNSGANPASGESRDVTAHTQFPVKPGAVFINLVSTKSAGISDLMFSPLVFPPAFITPSKSFVRQIRTSAQQADKIIGVMFKIPKPSVLRIMGSAIENNQIIQGIIKSVAVYVMNMLASAQDSSQMNLHDVSMQENAPRGSSGYGNLSISPGVIDPKFSIVDNNVIFYFYLRGIGDVDTHNNGIADKHIYLLVELGDVATHTAYVMNEAANIATRENLSPEDREVLIYSALAHDFAKPETTDVINKKGIDRITSHGHEDKGGKKAKAFLQSIGAPKHIIDKVVPLVQFHLSHIHHSNTPKQEAFVKSLAEKIHPANIRMLELLIEADHSGRPPLNKELPQEARMMSDLAKQHNVYEGKHPDLLQGRDIMPYLDNKGGPIVGEILKEHRNLILRHDPDMQSRESALAWLDRRMKKVAGLLNGNDIMNVLGLTGPSVKLMLDEAWRAQRMGAFSTKEQALEWLKQQ
jgi:tRNA nucleotidyltransferase/poly(A) polymerase